MRRCDTLKLMNTIAPNLPDSVELSDGDDRRFLGFKSVRERRCKLPMASRRLLDVLVRNRLIQTHAALECDCHHL